MGQSNSTTDTTEKRTIPASFTTNAISSSLSLGAGCYWGTEKFVIKDFQKMFPDSIIRAKVGFMSPNAGNKIKTISYEEVCHHSNSEFVEVLYVTLRDPQRHFEELIRFFFSFHDPTTFNRQGNDVGFQYGSYIFYEDEEQCRIAKKVRAQLNKALVEKKITVFRESKVTTKIVPSNRFIPAKKSHQQYLVKNPNGYCNHRIRLKKSQWPVYTKEDE